ncbi:MAG TPA: SIS domain-containing protein [Chloroflexota bacterium]|nr:SIS domain-containing protein [Chloroflexota bacterium]
MAELQDLVLEWASESAFIKQKFFKDHAAQVAACARDLTARLMAGGKLLSCGNGGSASDALHIAVEFTNPVIKERPPLPAMSLNADVAIVTSLANDFDYSEIFVRQVEVYARPGDALIGLSTSGDSPNVVKAIEAAKQRGLLTVALTGKGGGRCAELADYAFAVPSHNILRIQECHLTLYHILWDMVHTLLHYEPAVRRPAAGAPAAAAPAPTEAAEPVDPALADLYPFLFKS